MFGRWRLDVCALPFSAAMDLCCGSAMLKPHEKNMVNVFQWVKIWMFPK